MKKYYTLLILLLSFWSNAQNGITYQAVILNPNTEELPGADNSRLPLVNQNITLEFKILNATSLLDYQETIDTQTDAFGMVNVVIGTGTRKAGIATQFSGINWDGSAKTLIVSLDPSGQASHFIEISNQPFTYVPFALYAAHTGVAGTQGPAGNNGLDGKTVLNGATNPSVSIGANGDFYINTATSSLFGPKTNGVWGNSVPLVGPQGIQGPQGVAGTNGINGTNGLSAYQIWLNAGNIGTEAQFLTTLRGATGAQGPQGIQGVQGPIGLTGATGSQGLAGTNGTNGTNGLSAYQIWLNAGNTGTESQFLASLQGPQGIQGAAGSTGATTQNFVDLTTTQIVSGLKTFSDQLTSTVPTGIAPFIVTSTTPVANLSILGNAATATIVSSASQTAITNVGTLTSATVNGKVIVGASYAASTSAVLEANSTTQGFLPPRMTSTQRDLITSPTQGLIIYCTNCGTNGEVEVYDGISWTNISGSAVASSLPILTTLSATDITTTTAISGGNISFNGGAPISANGLCWSTAINPTISNSKTSDSPGTGSFLSTVTGLTPDTTYYFRAYATNSSGTSYGNQVTVTTAKQFFAYLFVDSNETGPRNALASYMASQGITNNNFRGFMLGIPSSDQTTFDAQMNAYLSYSGWGSSEPAIFSAPIPTISGGLDQYGVYKSAYQFETIQVPANTLPTGVYGQFVLFVPIAALNGNHYSTILQGYSPAGLNTFQVSPLKINNNELTIYYTGSQNLPAGDYKVYYSTPSFRLSPGGSQVYFHGGALVPN